MPMYRQGDVLIMSVDEVPVDLEEIPRDNGRVVLAYGEVTGHAHAIKEPNVRFLRDKITSDRFLDVKPTNDNKHAPVKLVHEEHAPIALPPGKYKVVTQREFVPNHHPRPVYD
jgi:hypothetical protein